MLLGRRARSGKTVQAINRFLLGERSFRFSSISIKWLVYAVLVSLLLANGGLLVGVALEQTGQIIQTDSYRRFLDRFNDPTYLKIPFNFVRSFFVSPPEDVFIDLKFKDYQNISRHRMDALETGVIREQNKKYYKAKLRFDGRNMPAKIRLKGTWTDHLDSDKWSFTIKTKGLNSFHEMKRFSIQHPKTRNFSREWLFSRVASDEEILAVKYDFLNVYINGSNRGIYALEEGLGTEMVERNNRREGLIFMFDEEPRRAKRGTKSYMQIFQDWRSSQITAYGMKKIKASPVLSSQFKEGYFLLEKFRAGKIKPSRVFSCEKFGQYFALLDVFGGSHGSHWNNLRFFFNPITRQFYPVARDVQPGILRSIMGDRASYQYFKDQYSAFDKSETIQDAFFREPAFYHCYMKSLLRYSSPRYLEEIKRKYGQSYKELVFKLHREWPYLNSSLDFIERNQIIIQATLGARFHVDARLVVTEKNADGSRKADLEVGNILTIPVEIIAVEFGNHNLIGEKTVYLNGKHPYSLTKYEHIPLDIGSTFENEPLSLKLVSKVVGTNLLIETIIKNVIGPGLKYTSSLPNPDIELLKKMKFVIIDKTNKEILFKKGHWIVENDLVIPANYILNIPAGTELRFSKDSAFLSYSPVRMMGSASEPVVLTANNDNWPGVVVLNTGLNHSELKNVIVEKARGIYRGGWQHSGTMNFYKSDVNLEKVTIQDNFSEDGLNIISSKFRLLDCNFQNIFSDAFDADFSEGVVKGTVFQNSGNDGIDVSGSNIKIKETMISKASDKALSAGEKSVVKVEDSLFSNSEIGVAAKDLSFVEIRNSGIKENQVGLAAYQKKPVYGPAKIVVITSIIQDNLKLEALEKNSVLEIDGKIYEGRKLNLAKEYTKAKETPQL